MYLLMNMLRNSLHYFHSTLLTKLFPFYYGTHLGIAFHIRVSLYYITQGIMGFNIILCPLVTGAG